VPFLPYQTGWIEVIAGPMFSGKSEELIRRVKRVMIAGQKVRVFKPLIDDRYHASDVVSHDGQRVQAEPLQNSAEILDALVEQKDLKVIAVDEAQFFDLELPAVLERAAQGGVRVIVAGLDMDFRGEPFGPMPALLARAEFVEKLSAVCVQCGRSATRTQRLINGEPARYDDAVILVGAKEAYEPRCRACHVVKR